MTEMDVSKIKGTLVPVGVPKQMGFVPNKDFKAPCGATAGERLYKSLLLNFF